MIEPLSQKTKNALVALSLRVAMDRLKEYKPNDKSETDRRYAVTITEMEKVYAYFMTYVAGEAIE